MNGLIIERIFDLNHITAYVIAILLIAVFVLLFYSFVYRFREMDAKILGVSQNSRLALVLQSGKLQLWIYNGPRRHYILMEGDRALTSECNPIEFAEHFDRNDFEELRKVVFEIYEGHRTSATVNVRGVKDQDGHCPYYEITVSIARYGAHGEIVDLLGIQRDITDETRRKENVNALLMRYHTVFNSALIDMLYYDKDGVLCDINEKACRTFGVRDRRSVLQDHFLLKNNPMFCNIDFSKLENTRTTSLVNFKNYQDDVYQLDRFGLQGKMYYESTINPIRNAEGELEGIYMSGRNVTELVESFHRQQDSIKELQQATKSIKSYIRNINYALQISGVRLVNYYPSSYTLDISNNINEAQLKLSQLRCIRLGTPRFRRAISSALNRMDHLTKRPIDLTIETEFRDKKNRQIWLMFNMVPMMDDEGNVIRYFGMCRNMTDQVETEQHLAIETKKAQETELLKQAFLTNMSYEIRTPLNTVVGFAELFESEHDVADEQLFVDEIRRNSNDLLKLVNDILYLSRLDANMIEYNKMETDFALLFESYCQMGWSTISPEVKTIVENPYERLLVDIDTEHVGTVIQKLCTHAANYTHQGTIRAKYEYRHGELTISIEDTGNGIDSKTLPRVFERFVRNEQEELCGTGLDLPIVQTLVQQMGGTIEIQSELGKGTTAWVIIPCEAHTIEKHRDIYA